ncbi:hypothetical protein H0H92_014056 [Tricholoma furcatifolium]|nr:hypothetical protein H0H92_014056 [Tricholoma furcatifolium]
MFFVKATYNGETRKFSFPQSKFPTFEQLYVQLNRVFPSTGSYHLSKLLFFPDSSQPARILIAGQVHNAEDYNKGIAPFRGRTWVTASLRFSVVDGASSGQGFYLNQPVGQLPWSGRSSGDTLSQVNAATPPLVPPPPFRNFPGTADMNRSFEPAPSNQSSSTSSCCAGGQVKKDIETLIKTFQRDLDVTMERLSESKSPVIPQSNAQTSNATVPTFVPPMPPPVPVQSTPPPPPVIHQGVFCDSCRLIIEGTRHKCLDCPDYDLCTSCIADGAQLRHDPTHEFLDLSEPGRVIVHTVNIPENPPAPIPEEPAAHQATSPPVVHHATCDLCDSVIEGHRYSLSHGLYWMPEMCQLRKSNILAIPSSEFQLDRTIYCAIQIIRQVVILPVATRLSFRRSFGQILGQAPTSLSSASLSNTEILSMNATPPEEDQRPPSPAPTQGPGPFDYSLYPLSAQSSLPVSENIDAVHATDHPMVNSIPYVVEHSPALSSASISLINVDDTPAVPGSWYGAGLTSLMHSPAERVVSGTDESLQHGKESPSMSSFVQEEAKLDRPPTPEIREVYAPNNRSLVELLSVQSSSKSDDGHAEKESSPHVIESPQAPSTEYFSLSTPTQDVEIKEEAVDSVEQFLSAGFVRDVTTPDGQILAAGVTFIKVWRMVNNGTQDWPANTEIVYVGGAQLANGNPLPHVQPAWTVGPLKIGEEKNVWTPELKAPDTPGEYISYWRMRGDNGELFGDNFWVHIEVVNPSESSQDDSLSSSSRIIMPDLPSPRSSAAEESMASTPTVGVDDMSDNDFSDDSSVSLLSMDTSEDEADWAESRAQAPAVTNPTQETNDHVPGPASQTAMDYVLLYDDNTSDED